MVDGDVALWVARFGMGLFFGLGIGAGMVVSGLTLLIVLLAWLAK